MPSRPRLTQSIRKKSLIMLSTAFMNFTETLRHLVLRRAIWLKRACLCYLAIPMLRPDTVGVTQPRWPGKHRLGKLDVNGFTKQSQHSFWIRQHILCINDRRNAIRSGADKIKNLRLLYESEVVQRRVFSFFYVRSNHLARVANQKAICHCA